MWFGADFLPHSHALPPRSSLRDINPAAVSGTALTFSRCTEVVLCRQISPSRKIHQGEGESTTSANTGMVPVPLGSAGVRSSSISRGQDDPGWGQCERKGLAKQILIPWEWGGGSREGEEGRGEPECEPCECSALLPAPSLLCTACKG